jgi:hypothetical protein
MTWKGCGNRIKTRRIIMMIQTACGLPILRILSDGEPEALSTLCGLPVTVTARRHVSLQPAPPTPPGLAALVSCWLLEP